MSENWNNTPPQQQPGPPPLPTNEPLTANDKRRNFYIVLALAAVTLVMILSKACPSGNSKEAKPAAKSSNRDLINTPTPQRIDELRQQTDSALQRLQEEADQMKRATEESANRRPMTREEALAAIQHEGQMQNQNRQDFQHSYDSQSQERATAQDRKEKEMQDRVAEEKKELAASNLYQQADGQVQFRNSASDADQQPGRRHPFSPEIGGAADSEPQLGASAEHAEQASLRRNPLDFDPSKVEAYWLPQGTVIQASLLTRINGEKPGPIMALVSQDVFYPNTRKVMVPAGAVAMGEAKAVSGQFQKRLAVFFHRVLVRTDAEPYGIPLDEPGLSQAGESGLTGKVNNHYASIFGASLAIGAIGGLSQIGNSGNYLDPSSQFRAGVSQQMAQSSEHILDRFLNQWPTIIIPAGQRVEIILTGDLPVPAYDTMKDLAAAAGPMVPIPDADLRRRREPLSAREVQK